MEVLHSIEAAFSSVLLTLPERLARTIVRPLVVQNDIEQRLMNLDGAVVFNKSEIAETIHEKTNSRPSSADHFRERFLGDFWNQCFRLTRLAEFRHQQQNSCQTLFTGIEELIDKVSLNAHAAGQEEGEEKI